MDAKEIQYLQRRWKQVKAHQPTGANQHGFECQSILYDLDKMGLDTSQNETYEILEDGLTKQDFDRMYCHAWITQVLDSYHQAQSLSTQRFAGEQPPQQYYGLQQLSEKFMPKLEELIAENGLPDDLPELRLAELDLLRNMHQNGGLERAVKLSANNAAIEYTRRAYTYMEKAKTKQADGTHLQECREGLSYADGALEAIDAAQEFYTPKDIPIRYDGWGGWKDDKGPYNREILAEMKEYFLLQESAIEFHQAYKFHQEGHYVLDASGSGHGMMRMPMQHIAEKLKEQGYDIRDPELFEQMGTDIDTFWNAYDTERQNVIKDDKYKLVKPQLKR
ncbi:MAG: hypothetical protein HND56_09390 [Pseudomonadota bacterium]|nr:hypothetical protein [Pseudomonadota bacterium]QKK05889.1 MAG: hypothetical protein HND56_09390 [Pseudomonadota bacterium]